MNFLQTMRVLRARRTIVVSTMFLCAMVATTVSLVHEKTYQAVASIVLQYKGIDPVTGRPLPQPALSNYVATQVDLITSKRVALKVVDDLNLVSSPDYRQQFKETGSDDNIRSWIAARLLKKLEVQPSRESNVVQISFTANSPDFAALVANGFVDAYLQTSASLKRDPLLNAASYIDGQLKELRDALETAQGNFSRHQQEHGIVNAESRLDVETARLNELSSQLVMAEAQNVESRAHKQHASAEGELDSADIINNPLVQSRQQALANAQAQLAELGLRYGKNHPQYQSVEAEITALQRALNQQVGKVAKSIAGNAQISQQRENELRAAVARQKLRVLELNGQRDKAALLSRQLENAQKVYDIAAQRLAQTSFEGQAHQGDAAVLSLATSPAEPTCLPLWQVVLLSLFFGALTGSIFAVLAEINDRRIRSAGDLCTALAAPVLATVRLSPPLADIEGMSAMLRIRRLSETS